MDKEIKIARNMLALAARRKGKNKRSMMLRMVMPFLSRQTGDDLADSIDRHDPDKFEKVWNRVRSEISNKIRHSGGRHSATASAEAAKDFPGIYEEATNELAKLTGPVQPKITEEYLTDKLANRLTQMFRNPE